MKDLLTISLKKVLTVWLKELVTAAASKVLTVYQKEVLTIPLKKDLDFGTPAETLKSPGANNGGPMFRFGADKAPLLLFAALYLLFIMCVGRKPPQ